MSILIGRVPGYPKETMIVEKRWAIAGKFDDGWRLLGKYWWIDKEEVPEPNVRTFRTRHEARCVKKQLLCCSLDLRIVKVEVIIREIAK